MLTKSSKRYIRKVLPFSQTVGRHIFAIVSKGFGCLLRIFLCYLREIAGLDHRVQRLNYAPCVKNKVLLLHKTPVPPEEFDLTIPIVLQNNQTIVTPFT